MKTLFSVRYRSDKFDSGNRHHFGRRLAQLRQQEHAAELRLVRDYYLVDVRGSRYSSIAGSADGKGAR